MHLQVPRRGRRASPQLTQQEPQRHPPAIGILGGTFNPPHLGHLALAEHALAELSLDRVALMPAHIAPHKLGERDPGPRHRLAMCELLIGGHEGLAACGLELERAAPSYTVDTLTDVHARHPDAALTFILGADTACTLGSWREPRRVLELASLAVADREGAPRERVLRTILRFAGAHGEGARIAFLEMAAIGISSSLVRRRAAAGEPVDELVGVDVARYIAEHRLYRAAAPAGEAR